MLMSFGFLITSRGATVIADRAPLHEACTTLADVDREVEALKADLDRVARAMKIALAKRRKSALTRAAEATARG